MTWIADHKLKQTEAAEILKVSRPRVSDVVNKKVADFTLDSLNDFAGFIGKCHAQLGAARPADLAVEQVIASVGANQSQRFRRHPHG